MAEWITSKTNATVQLVRKLMASRKYRYEYRAFVADGAKLAEEALRWGLGVDALLLREGVDFPVPAGVRELRVPEGLMREISRMETPQGVLALCRMPEPAPLELVPGSLILDGLQDPGNLGTILRAADAFDVPVVLADGCADPYGEKTVRATMGAVFRRPPVQAETQAILDQCRARGLPVCVTALSDRAEDIRRVDLKACVTVIGSEGQGVSEAFLAAAAREAIIPMSPRCESLNAAVAATVVLWELRRECK
ncbi:MAG: RNA methyltransferase [Oscillospiraceae bacterium]|nr:RNA methyltransferase [Oscillospiraceae bacterium]MBR7009965.1 RNA methyltransferase [Oscillospiraceae bacterium]